MDGNAGEWGLRLLQDSPSIVGKQTAYSAVSQAVESARAKGYGVVAPEKEEVLLEPQCL